MGLTQLDVVLTLEQGSYIFISLNHIYIYIIKAFWYDMGSVRPGFDPIFISPLFSGYMLFMSDQRENIRLSNPHIGFPEITKMVAQKWANLEMSEKQKYLDAADTEKER